jgi:hypothetical protein
VTGKRTELDWCDRVILWLRSNMIVRLELPAARQHEEQLKISKEQKARASVLQF